jgi:hypothetical protein
MQVTHLGRESRLDMIPPFAMPNGFALSYEGGSGDRHRVRLSRNLPGAVFEGTLDAVLTEFRWHRRSLPDRGVLAMAFWLVDSRSMYDALIGGDDNE